MVIYLYFKICNISPSKGEIIAQGTYTDLQKEDIDFVSILTSEKGEDFERSASTTTLQKVSIIYTTSIGYHFLYNFICYY